MILGNPSVGIGFKRLVAINPGKINVKDEFTGDLLPAVSIYRAQHYSLRHVSSAGQFVTEELIEIDETRHILPDGEKALVLEKEIILKN